MHLANVDSAANHSMSIISRLPLEVLGYMLQIGNDVGWEEDWEDHYSFDHPTLPVSRVCGQWRDATLATRESGLPSSSTSESFMVSE